MAAHRRRADGPLLGDGLLLSCRVQARAMSAERTSASTGRAIVGLDVVSLGARRVVVVDGLAGPRGVERSYLGHYASFSSPRLPAGTGRLDLRESAYRDDDRGQHPVGLQVSAPRCASCRARSYRRSGAGTPDRRLPSRAVRRSPSGSRRDPRSRRPSLVCAGTDSQATYEGGQSCSRGNAG
jgi:hypothetical protein